MHRPSADGPPLPSAMVRHSDQLVRPPCFIFKRKITLCCSSSKQVSAGPIITPQLPLDLSKPSPFAIHLLGPIQNTLYSVYDPLKLTATVCFVSTPHKQAVTRKHDDGFVLSPSA